MDTYTDITDRAAKLNRLKVVQLREIAKQMGFVGGQGDSRYRKADLVNLLAIVIDNAWDEAIETNIIITEAYIVPAEKAGITIGAYLACQTAHRKAGQIRISGFWSSERESKTMVVVFDNGQKQAVTRADARMYRGETFEMPTHGYDEICKVCGETYFVEKDDITVDAFLKEIMAAIQPLAERAQRYQNEAIESDNPEAEQWVQMAKDTIRLVGDVEWLQHYRNPITLTV